MFSVIFSVPTARMMQYTPENVLIIGRLCMSFWLHFRRGLAGKVLTSSFAKIAGRAQTIKASG